MFKDKSDNLVVKLPFGFRDIFPLESAERKNIKDIIRKEFKLWGYGEVKTPVVEFTKNISAGVGKNWENKLINFFDIDGSLVSLRTDMTIPIARLTGMRIKKNQLPVRFCYFANSFRQSSMQKGVKRTYNQAGLEFIGSSSFMSDVEVIIILINILKKLELSDYKIGLGHIEIIKGLFRWFNLQSSEKEYIRKNLVLKNFVAIEEFLEKKNEKKADIFLKLIKPEQNIENVFRLIEEIKEEKTMEGFIYLENVYKILQQLDLDKYLIIDLSILRDFEYYTGLLFEVYSMGITDILGSGGRYDGLIKKFGLDVPATGFALDIDLLHKSMKDSKLNEFRDEKKLLLYSETKNYSELIRISNIIRSGGIIVEMVFDKGVNLENLAKEKKCGWLAVIEPGLEDISLVDLSNNKRKVEKLSIFVKEVGRIIKK